MATQLPGNVMRPPVTTTVVAAAPEEVLGSTKGLVQKGGTVAQGSGVIRAGELMAYNSGTGYWTVATDTTVEAINRTAVDTTDGPALINLIHAGVVNTKVSGITNGLTSTALATRLGNIATALKGRLVPAQNYLIF